MITILFIFLMVSIFGRLIGFAIKACWSLTKVFFTILLLPAILITLAVSGFIWLAFLALIVVGVVELGKRVIA